MSEMILVTTTFESDREAEKMAEILVDYRLAGCAQISGPITSVYRWKGKIENSQEYCLSVKTVSALYQQLEKHIKENHPYDTPEIIATPVINHSQEYGDWLENQLHNPDHPSHT